MSHSFFRRASSASRAWAGRAIAIIAGGFGWALCSAIAWHAGPAAAQPARYTLTLIEPPPGIASLAFDAGFLNDDGMVAGTAIPQGPFLLPKAFRWTAAGGFELVPTSRFQVSRVRNLDAGGNLRGIYDGPRTGRDWIGLWDAAGRTSRIRPGTVRSGNGRGDLLVWSSPGFRPVVFTAEGDVLALPPDIDAVAINAQRLVTGSLVGAGAPAVVWRAGQGVQQIAVVPSEGRAVNDLGVVAGYEVGRFRPFRWSADLGYQRLDRLTLCSAWEPTAINDAGAIVGGCLVSAPQPGTGWIWTEQDGMWPLYRLIDPADPRLPGLHIGGALAINRHGAIVGVAFSPADVGRTFLYLLTPTAAR